MTLYLDTPRLLIRDWQPLGDAIAATNIYCDPQVTQWIGNGANDGSLAAVHQRLQRYVARTQAGLGTWAVVEKRRERVIGNLLLVPLADAQGEPTSDIEIGWHFRAASWGYGYATEAAQQILEYGHRSLGLAAIFAVTLPTNQRSIAVMERLGMECLGLTDKYYGRSLCLYRSSFMV